MILRKITINILNKILHFKQNFKLTLIGQFNIFKYTKINIQHIFGLFYFEKQKHDVALKI
jgi:hypothetical protein